jgi:mRNA-degrading endonuclease RelE of RelBE toxin-antitoxin system
MRVNDAILETIEGLKTFPERNDVAENISKREVIYRRIMAKSYRIVYTVNKDKIQVIVVDVDYGPRSQERLVKKFG